MSHFSKQTTYKISVNQYYLLLLLKFAGYLMMLRATKVRFLK